MCFVTHYSLNPLDKLGLHMIPIAFKLFFVSKLTFLVFLMHDLNL